MRFPYTLAGTVLIATVSAASAQESQPIQRWPTRGGQGAPAGPGPRAAGAREPNQGRQEARPGADAFRPARPQDARPGVDAFRPAVPRRESQERFAQRGREFSAPPQTAAPQVRGGSEGQVFAQRRAEPRGGRSRGDNPRTGTARQRGGSRPTQGYESGRRVYPAPRAYNNYYYSYPRRSYPYWYGAFGLGYFYYDPYVWRGNSWAYSGYGYGSGYGSGSAYPAYGYDAGKLRLQVQPRDAEVYIDGYFSGIVDDFDGRLQGLTLETGGYSVEIVAPGFEPLAFDIRITPGRTTTYRGELLPRLP